MPSPAGEQLGTQTVDEDDHGAACRTKGAVSPLRQPRDSEAGGNGRQQPVQPGGGREQRCGHHGAQCPMLAERSRANSMARSSAVRPSASALIRRAMSSLVMVPS